MKKKRSIQKLTIHKETISTLNKITGGDGITATSMTAEPKPKEKVTSPLFIDCITSILLRCV
jgi:hypothetical protein